MSLPLEAGSLVEVRGERWLLTAATPHGTCTVLTLEGRDRANATERLRVIDPFDRSRRIARAALARRPRRAVLRAALGAIVDARSDNTLWVAASAGIDVWPYQLEPALAAIGGTTRLLLADGVGLGKTIQAGLLLAELRERGWVDRALIVCPAGLRETWARELRQRFAIEATVLDQAGIAGRIATLPPGVNPWGGHAVTIASVDFIKRPEVLAAIEREPLDLVIADEAHHLTPGTDRGSAVSRLASRATWSVLISATPHSGDEAAFDYLRHIGAHGDSLAIFRRTRADVGLASRRRSSLLPIRPTDDEAALFAGIDQYARAIWRERGPEDRTVRLIAVTLLRRAASSANAIARTLARRLDLLGTLTPQPVQPLLPWAEDDDTDGVEADAILATPGLRSPAEERSVITRLLELSRRCVVGSKLRRLARLLDRVREPAVVFTEYRDTLEAIVKQLELRRRVAAIHGGLPADIRRDAVDAFNAGRVEVLVATDAAGEGLNLHHRSRLVIDVELPWNPLRLEQRAGRVDRLGQRRTVHAIRFFHPHTIEHQVLAQLAMRGRRAAAALDRHQLTEAAIAEAIFDGRPTDVTGSIDIASTCVTTAPAEAQRIAQQRAAHRLGARSAHQRLWSRPRHRRSTNFVILGRRRHTNALGLLVDEALEAHVVRLPPAATRREWRQVLESAWADLARSPESGNLPQLDRAAIERRIRHIRKGLARARIERQASLFDRRAELAQSQDQRTLERLNDALDRTWQSLSPLSPERTRLELVAAWPEKSR